MECRKKKYQSQLQAKQKQLQENNLNCFHQKTNQSIQNTSQAKPDKKGNFLPDL